MRAQSVDIDLAPVGCRISLKHGDDLADCSERPLPLLALPAGRVT